MRFSATWMPYRLRCVSARRGEADLIFDYGRVLSSCRQGASVEEMTIEVNKKKAALDNARRDVKQMLSLIKACLVSRHDALPLICVRFRIGAQEVYDSASDEMAFIPSSHRSALQGLLPVPPLEPRLLRQSPLRSCRGIAAAQSESNLHVLVAQLIVGVGYVGANGRPDSDAEQPGEGPSLPEWWGEILLDHLPSVVPVGVDWMPDPLSRCVCSLP